MEELKNWNVWAFETEEMEAPIDVKVKTNYLDRTKTLFSDCPTNCFIFHKLFSKIIILNILNYNQKFTLFFNK